MLFKPIQFLSKLRNNLEDALIHKTVIDWKCENEVFYKLQKKK